MKKYIKVNGDNEIIDVFFKNQKEKFDGTEILFENTEIKKEKINGKSISSEYGVYIFIWDGNNAVEKTQSEIDNDVEFIVDYKQIKIRELKAYINEKLFETTRTLEEIRLRLATFKSDLLGWTTKQQIEDAYDQEIVWIDS